MRWRRVCRTESRRGCAPAAETRRRLPPSGPRGAGTRRTTPPPSRRRETPSYACSKARIQLQRVVRRGADSGALRRASPKLARNAERTPRNARETWPDCPWVNPPRGLIGLHSLRAAQAISKAKGSYRKFIWRGRVGPNWTHTPPSLVWRPWWPLALSRQRCFRTMPSSTLRTCRIRAISLWCPHVIHSPRHDSRGPGCRLLVRCAGAQGDLHG